MQKITQKQKRKENQLSLLSQLAKATNQNIHCSCSTQFFFLWNHHWPNIALLAVFRAAFQRSLFPHSLNLNQVIKARFGARTHLVFCTFAFFTNLIVMMSLTVAGTAVLNRYFPTLYDYGSSLWKCRLSCGKAIRKPDSAG